MPTDNRSVAPISDAQARAAEAMAKTTQEAIQALRGFGAYLERVFGTVPEDLVGYLGGDRLKVARAENIVRIMERSKAINDVRHVEPEPISISLALPLLVAAAEPASVWERRNGSSKRGRSSTSSDGGRRRLMPR